MNIRILSSAVAVAAVAIAWTPRAEAGRHGGGGGYSASAGHAGGGFRGGGHSFSRGGSFQGGGHAFNRGTGANHGGYGYGNDYDSGISAADIQQALAQEGYYRGGDGVVGYGTQRAICNFQANNGLPVRGRIAPFGSPGTAALS